jgi:hypothetical protein
MAAGVGLAFAACGGSAAPRKDSDVSLGQGVFLSGARLQVLKERIAGRIEPTYQAYVAMHREASARLDGQLHVPETWYVPGFYRDAEGHAAAKGGLQEDANTAYALALCYRLTGDPGYAAGALRRVNGWATGVQEMRTADDSKLCFSYHFPALIFAADLLKNCDGWALEDRRAFTAFVREKALPMNTMRRANNWGNWGLVLFLAATAWLEDGALFDHGVKRWKSLLGSQIAADGHLAHEVHRNNGVGERGIWYSHFALMPQTLAAEIVRVNGVDLFEYVSPRGRTLRQAFERVAPWARDPETFPYFKGEDRSELRGTDYVSYFELLNARWPHPDAGAMLERLRPLTANHSAPYLTLTHGDLLEP